LLKPLSGRLFWKNEKLPRGKPERFFGRIGLVFQNPDYQLFDSTVERECAFCLRNHSVRCEVISDRVEKWLGRFDLLDLKDRSPLTLSYGEKRRLTLASILVAEPELLLLDEPTTALDESAISDLRKQIQNMVRQTGLSVCLATHDADFALDIADRIVFLTETEIEVVPVHELNSLHLHSRNLPLPLTSQITMACGLSHRPVGFWTLHNQFKDVKYEKTA
jgi:energy-coupling factor transporter ATP-binding protein EcfA2